MAKKLNLGQLAESNDCEAFICKEVTWKIPNLLWLPEFSGTEARSPEFSFANATWVLCMNIYEEEDHRNYDDYSVYEVDVDYSDDAEKFAHFTVRRLKSLIEEQEVWFKFLLKTCHEQDFADFSDCYTFTSEDNEAGAIYSTDFYTGLLQSQDMSPENTHILVCRMHTKSTAVEDSSEKKVLQYVRSTGGETAQQTTNSTKMSAAPTNTKLIQDLENLFLNMNGSDVILQVKGQKFEAHRAILRARSSVFTSMLGHDMKEKNTGLIDIEDCDPENFSDFLYFLYCGDAESIITSQNVYSLYRTADKYDVQDLESECLKFIKNHLEVDNFCDVFVLALQHSETHLMKQATDFFAKNMLKIIMTVKWQVFLEENSTIGNGLIIKALSTDKEANS